jgi:ATP-binding cassette, subfamily B, bacterial PglK
VIKERFRYLDKAEKKTFIYILIAMIIFAFVEGIGLGFILPYLSIIKDTSSINDYSLIQKLFENYNEIDIVVGMSVIFLVLFLVKTIFQLYINYLIAKFPYDLLMSKSTLLHKIYLNTNYLSLVRNNSNELVKNLTKTIDMSSYSYVVFLQYLSSIITTLVLIMVLFINDFLTSVSLIVIFGTMGFLMYYNTKNIQIKAGKSREEALSEVYKHASESILSIKEIKLNNKELFFNSIFHKSNAKLASALKRNIFIPTLPSTLLEFIAIVIIVTIVIFFISTGKDLSILVVELIFYVAVGKKLLPSISTILSAKMNLKTLDVSFDIIYRELNNYTLDRINCCTEKNKFNEKIEFKNLNFNYNTKNKALNDVSFEIKKKHKIAFIGSSGAGKSTLIEILTSLIYKDDGTIFLDGKEVESLLSIKHLVGYVPQMVTLLDNTIENNIAFGEKTINNDNLKKAIKMAHLEDLIGGLDDGIKTNIGERGVRISGGQRQRIGIARALYFNPEILIFDESTSALDNVSEKIIASTIDKLSNNKTIIAIAHRLTTIKDFDRIYIMDKGRILEYGTHVELLKKSNIYRELNLIKGGNEKSNC